jgi:5'-methylthioadenosine phosphorylase
MTVERQKPGIGVILGNGFEGAYGKTPQQILRTPYGDAELFLHETEEVLYYLVKRHGSKRQFPGHRLPSKQYISALYMKNVRKAVAFSAVGGVSEQIEIGEFVVPDQFIDLGGGHGITFCDNPAIHVDITSPFCSCLRNPLLAAAMSRSDRFHAGGVYACMPGPRFETAAEIRMIRTLGGDVVGHSAVQEAVLCREIGICYSVVCLVTNLGAGRQSKVTTEEINSVVGSKLGTVESLLAAAFDGLEVERPCGHMNDFEQAKDVASRILHRPRWLL